MFVPVLNQDNQPLMPTIPSRARRWIKSGKATPFWKHGIFCIRLNQKSLECKQDIALGVDPGSKKEGYTAKSKAHTYLNIQADAIDWVKNRVQQRSMMRRTRRSRNTPYRKCRYNRKVKKGWIPPSTKARWEWKLTIINYIKKVLPITHIVVEDIKTKTIKGDKTWNKSFSPLQSGKNWFYSQIDNLTLVQGYQTKEMRDSLGLEKSKDKLGESWNCHCVDSFVLANSVVGGGICDNKRMLLVSPIKLIKRQLHKLQLSTNGRKTREGGTISLGFKKGSLIKNKKYGICYIGGNMKGMLSLHNKCTGIRITQKAKSNDCKIICYNRIKSYINIET